MERREFIKITGAASAAIIPGFHLNLNSKLVPEDARYARYKGFNLLEKFIGQDPRKRFNEEDFQIMNGWGFDFDLLIRDFMLEADS